MSLQSKEEEVTHNTHKTKGQEKVHEEINI